MIYLNLLESDINDNYKDIIKGNLTKFRDYKQDDYKCYNNDYYKGNKLDIVLQGKFNENVLTYFMFYNFVF